jgi:hypothetical protein
MNKSILIKDIIVPFQLSKSPAINTVDHTKHLSNPINFLKQIEINQSINEVKVRLSRDMILTQSGYYNLTFYTTQPTSNDQLLFSFSPRFLNQNN